MSESSGYQMLCLPRGDTKVRVAVSRGLLKRAPWLPEGLESVIAVAGEWWPEDACIGDDLDWVCFSPDNRAFVVYDWVLEPPGSSRKPYSLIQRLVRVLCPLMFVAANSNVWYLADALYQQLSQRDPLFAEFFLRKEFVAAVQAEWFRRIMDGGGRWRFAFILLVVGAPLSAARLFYGGCLYAAFAVLVKFCPKCRLARYKQIRILRRFKGFRRALAEAKRTSLEEFAAKESDTND